MALPSPTSHRLALVIAGAGLLLAPLQGSAQRTSEQITAADLRSRLYRIADDSMAGRATGSKGNWQTAEYVAAEFKRLGLKPGGDNGGWFQKVPFYRSVAAGGALGFKPGTPATGGGAEHVFLYTADGGHYLLLGRPAGGGELHDTPVISGGFANDSTTWPDAAAMAGKFVVLEIKPDADGRRRPLAQLNQLFNNRRFAQSAAIAVAELDLLGPGATSYMGVRPTIDTTRAPARPAQLVVSPELAKRAMTGPAPTVGGSAALTFAPLQYDARNVIGILPGRDPKLAGEYVVVSGHNDHVGICGPPVDHDSLRAHNRVIRPMGVDSRDRVPTADEAREIQRIRDSLARAHPARADSICNGADDDGTGTAALLELAEAFASIGSSPENPLPRRSILFISHAAEEIGLVGSAWFTDHPTVPIDSIIASIDEDMIGRGSVHDLPEAGPTYLEVIGGTRVSKEFGEILEAANQRQKLPFVFNDTFNAPGHPLRYFCRADHYNYARYGIPAVAFSRGEHLDYHQVTDEAQYIDYDSMNRVVHMVFDAVVALTGVDHRPALNQPKGDPHARCVQ